MKRSIALVLVLGGLIAAGIGVLSATAGNSTSTEAARPMQSRASQASPAPTSAWRSIVCSASTPCLP